MFLPAKKNPTRFDNGDLNAGDLEPFMKRGPGSTFLSAWVSPTRDAEGTRRVAVTGAGTEGKDGRDGVGGSREGKRQQGGTERCGGQSRAVPRLAARPDPGHSRSSGGLCRRRREVSPRRRAGVSAPR